MLKKNNKLFENSDSDEEYSIKTNVGYAKHYDEFRKKEILSHLNNISDEDSSTDDASTDDELVNPEFESEFLKSLAFLKSKDPNKYKKIPKFFENVETVENTIKERQQKKSQKPVTVADYQRERLIKTEGRMSEDDEEPNNLLSYVDEQEKIKDDLKKALKESSDEDDDEGLFKVRDKPREEIKQEEDDYLKWLAGQKKETKNEKVAKELKPLKDFWTSSSLPKADQFLRDYIVNKRYLDHGNVQSYEDVVGLSEDEKEVEEQAEYETKYNFRFEEPDEEFIKRYPRNVEDTVRAEDNSRKEKRKERQERKVKEKEIKMKDLRELQNIRKREIEQKLMLLKEVAGDDEFTLKEDDLNADFDPDEHDKRMSAMFNNDYYGIDEGDKKPEFPDIDEELNIENWDNFDKTKAAPIEPHCDDEDFNMDCDYNPEKEKKEKLQNELIEMSKGRKRRKKISKLAEIIRKEKPSYDPAADKTYEEYLDEYYKLDYEDIIGDQPCRFRYTECVPNDFGLTVEEILLASNKELNQWASLKKTMQNRPKNVEMNDVEKYNRRRNNIDLKKKIFASMYGKTESDDESGDEQKTLPKTEEMPETSTSSNIKEKANKITKKNSNEVHQKTPPKGNSKEIQQKSKKRKLNVDDEKPAEKQETLKKKKFNHNKKDKRNNHQNPNELSDNRLKAFGINPKKFKNKIKYGAKNQNKQQNQHKNVNKKNMKMKS